MSSERARNVSGVLRGAAAAGAFAGCLLGAAGAASAGETRVGPEIGNNRYRGAISGVLGGADTDDFVQDLLPGERLSFEVSARGKGAARTLRPVVVLIDPTGLERSSGIRRSEDGTRVRLDRFTVDRAGRWAVRVRGADDTTGEYDVRFRVEATKPIRLTRQRLGNDQPFFRIHPFSGFEGARFSARLVADERSLPVSFRSLADPSGAEVLVEDAGGELVPAVGDAVVRGNRTSLDAVPLSLGSGTYNLRVRIPTGTATYGLTIRVDPPPRPAGKKVVVLSDAEPFLVPRSEALGADAGIGITLDGEGFSTERAPRVFFGRREGSGVVVAADGRSLTVVVPPRDRDDVVAVRVVNPDGQTACRDGYFAYVPPPTILDIVDATTLEPVRRGPTTGGLALRVVGTNLRTGYRVRLGTATLGGEAVIGTPTTTAGEGSAAFTLPAGPPGDLPVAILDPYGRSTDAAFTFFLKTPPGFGAQPYSPAALRLGVATVVTVRGTAFEPEDVWTFRGLPIPTTFVDAGTRTISLPALGEGSYAITVTDRIGTTVTLPPIEVKFPPVVSAVTVVQGDAIGLEIPYRGGTVLRVDGTNFLPSDTVTLGGTVVTGFGARGRTSFEFTAPGGLPGTASLVVTDGAGQSVTAGATIRYSGFEDAPSRVPAPSSTDHFGSWRGAIGDLDRDGLADDVVLVSEYASGSPGSRASLARLLRGGTTGALTDVTATSLPATRSDSRRGEVFDGSSVAIGDLDQTNGADIVLGGMGANYAPGVYGTAPDVRILKNGGTGTFTLDEANGPLSRYVPGVFAYYSGYAYIVKTALAPAGRTTAVALGDVDKDGDLDLVVGHDQYDQRGYGVSPSLVDYSTNPPSLPAPVGYYSSYFKYSPAVRIYENRTSAGQRFTDVSATKLPSAGDNRPGSTLIQPPALHCRDLALGDVDKDGDLDLVVAWDDPRTVTAYGFYARSPYATVPPPPSQVATQVLLNDGRGKFTNATPTWMPGASGDDYWQASRMKLADLDADGDLDLVLLHAAGVDAHATATPARTRSALRILRNDGTRFTDLTASALPAPDTAASEDYRGGALAVRDVNGDGIPDILVSTLDVITGSGGEARRSVRLFAGRPNLTFTQVKEFLPPGTADTGAATDLLFVDDLGGAGSNRLLLTQPSADPARTDQRRTRDFDWRR